MLKILEKISGPTLIVLAAFMAGSFLLSVCRLMSMATPGKPYEGGYCEPLMIDQAEPFLSTRWFCHSEKP